MTAAMIFRIKLHWWCSLTVAAMMASAAWTMGVGTKDWRGQFDSYPIGLVWGLAAAVVCLAVNGLVHCTLRLILGQCYARLFHEYAMDIVGRMGPMAALCGGLMAGVGEEPLFRGVLVPALGAPVVGVIGSAVVFGLAHYINRKYWGFFLWAIGEGILFGTLYVVSDSILVPALAHGTFDTVGFLYFQRLRGVANRHGCH